MFSKIQDSKTKHIDSIVTQQYEIGTYIIINNNPALQGSSKKEEKAFHINIRKKALKNNDIIIAGTILDYNGKLPINEFKDEIE